MNSLNARLLCVSLIHNLEDEIPLEIKRKSKESLWLQNQAFATYHPEPQGPSRLLVLTSRWISPFHIFLGVQTH